MQRPGPHIVTPEHFFADTVVYGSDSSVLYIDQLLQSTP